MSAYITGLGVCLPNKPVPNEKVESVLGMISDRPSSVKNLILARNGIKWRYYAVEPETQRLTHTNAELTADAVKRLGLGGGNSSGGMDLLVCGTSSPDQMIPNHACMVLGLLGTHACEAVSTAGVCCSGMTAMKYAYLSVRTGSARGAVATGSELASSALRSSQFTSRLETGDEENPYINFDQEFLRFMLSDGAGAARITDRPREDGLSLRIDWIDIVCYANEVETCMYAGAVKQPDGSLVGWRQEESDFEEVLKKGYFNLSQDVNALARYIVPMAGKALQAAFDNRELKAEQVDYFLPHLSSMFFKKPLFEMMQEAGLDIPLDRWFTNLPYKGNTGAASIYIILEELVNSGKLNPGDRLLCAVPESARFTYALMHLTVE